MEDQTRRPHYADGCGCQCQPRRDKQIENQVILASRRAARSEEIGKHREAINRELRDKITKARRASSTTFRHSSSHRKCRLIDGVTRLARGIFQIAHNRLIPGVARLST